MMIIICLKVIKIIIIIKIKITIIKKIIQIQKILISILIIKKIMIRLIKLLYFSDQRKARRIDINIDNLCIYCIYMKFYYIIRDI
jgi:hypothetical protein